MTISDDQAREAAKLKTHGYDSYRIAKELGISLDAVGEAVSRGLALREAEWPAEAVQMAAEMRANLIDWETKLANGDKHARKIVPMLRKSYRVQVALARRLNPGWEPEPLPPIVIEIQPKPDEGGA